MIKFFRKIRHKLLQENRVSKYLVYAFGEIILVVIGILIALQINNWNEEQNAKAFETKMLKEIRMELIQDTIYFNLIKKRAKLANLGGQKMAEYYAKDYQNTDSLTKYGQQMFLSFQFIYHKGSYEALKATGLDRISNDSLRLLITDMYDFRIPRAIGLMGYNDNKLSSAEELQILTDIEVQVLPNGSTKPTLHPKRLKGNKQALTLIFDKTSNSGNSAFRLQNLINACERLLKLLDKELQIVNPKKNMPKNIWE